MEIWLVLNSITTVYMQETYLRSSDDFNEKTKKWSSKVFKNFPEFQGI